jgi:hypothetical protein
MGRQNWLGFLIGGISTNESAKRKTAHGRLNLPEKVRPDEGFGGLAIDDRDHAPPPSVGSLVPGSQQSRHLRPDCPDPHVDAGW